MNVLEWKKKHGRSRRYTHFDEKIALNESLWGYINNPKMIEKHGFYPFIHYTLSFKKYNKMNGIKEKSREICYSSHIDRYIFQFYGHKLNQVYNKRVREYGIDESVIAYRDNLHKNNIHFAKRAIDFIRDSQSCYIIIGDFTKFFDRLDHKYLKNMLCDLLQFETLPGDYFAVYKNITKYSTWDLTDLLKLNGLKNNEDGIKAFNDLERALPVAKFRELKKQYIKRHACSFGIPQGSAISAVLSNIYMLEFDKRLSDYIKSKKGLYMRYSDDFILILPKQECNGVDIEYRDVYSVINSTPLLELEHEKTQIFEYEKEIIKSSNELVFDNVNNGKNIMNYLGFSFDGKKVALRDKTISKYYYRLYRKLKTVIKNNGITKTGKRISFENIYEKYSVKGAKVTKGKRGNFITYVRKAERIFENEKEIGLVSKRHMQKIRRRLKRIR